MSIGFGCIYFLQRVLFNGLRRELAAAAALQFQGSPAAHRAAAPADPGVEH